MEVFSCRRSLAVFMLFNILLFESQATDPEGNVNKDPRQYPQEVVKVETYGQARQASVNDFLSQLNALASQATVVGNGLGSYQQVIRQQFNQNNQHQFPYRPPYRPYQQRPYPYPVDNLQNLQYQQNQVLSQGPNGGYGLASGGQTYPRPPLASSPSLVAALQSVARYDDARCVPRLLCEVTAGGTPGSARDTALPFVNRDTLLSLLTVLNFGHNSPLLVFGRAALLGYMAQGDPATCISAYPTCPRDPDQLVDYLNNHNGGFFRFFNSGSNHNNFLQQQSLFQQNQFLNQLGNPLQHYAPNYRDTNHYTDGENHSHIQSRIITTAHNHEVSSDYPKEAFFPNVNQRPQKTFSFSSDAGLQASNVKGTRLGRKFNFRFPASEQTSSSELSKPSDFRYGDPIQSNTQPQPGSNEQFLFQGESIGQHLLEPNLNGELPTFTLDDGEYTFVNPYTQTVNKNGDMVKNFTFPVIHVSSGTDSSQNNGGAYYVSGPQQKPLVPMNFPDKTGTGDLRLDFDQSFLSPSGNPYAEPVNRPVSASTSIFRDDVKENRFSLTQGKRENHRLRFPRITEEQRL